MLRIISRFLDAISGYWNLPSGGSWDCQPPCGVLWHRLIHLVLLHCGKVLWGASGRVRGDGCWKTQELSEKRGDNMGFLGLSHCTARFDAKNWGNLLCVHVKASHSRARGECQHSTPGFRHISSPPSSKGCTAPLGLFSSHFPKTALGHIVILYAHTQADADTLVCKHTQHRNTVTAGDTHSLQLVPPSLSMWPLMKEYQSSWLFLVDF